MRTDTDPSHYFGVAPSIDVEKHVSGDGMRWEDADEAPGLVLAVCGDTSLPPGTPPDCGTCEGRVTTLTLKYNGTSRAWVKVVDKNGVKLFAAYVEPGKTFTVNGKDKQGTLSPDIRLTIGSQTWSIHTSCSQPIYPGLKAGPFEVVEGYSRYGGRLCPPTTLSTSSGFFSTPTTCEPVPCESRVYFRFTVTNNGDVPLSTVTLTDDSYDLGHCPAIPEPLAPGASRTCVVGPLAVEEGLHQNEATATGKFEGYTVEDVDVAHYTGRVGPGTGTPGYWRNHPDAWPVESIEIGGVTYTKAQAIAHMGTPPSGDVTYILFRALVSARLNALVGNTTSCIDNTLALADAWLMKWPLGGKVAASSEAWRIGEPLYEQLDRYNNGLLCAPHRDSGGTPLCPPEACGPCDGRVTQLTLQYRGTAREALVEVFQKDGKKAFAGRVWPGDSFTFKGVRDDGTLDSEISVRVDGRLNATVHTSCSQPIYPGLVAGDFKVVDGYSRNGGRLCPPTVTPPPQCGTCDGKVTWLRLRYNGTTKATILVRDKDGRELFKSEVSPGATLSFSGKDSGDTMTSDIRLWVGSTLVATIHTSCSQAIGPGLKAGPFEVLEGKSRYGGTLCPMPPPPPPTGTCGPCSGKVTWLTLRYTGPANATVIAADKEGKLLYEGTPTTNSTFTVTGRDKKGTLTPEIRLWIDGKENASIHTSCSQPIYPGLTRGAFVVVEGASRGGGSLCPLPR